MGKREIAKILFTDYQSMKPERSGNKTKRRGVIIQSFPETPLQNF
jgi:hypothetical protein